MQPHIDLAGERGGCEETSLIIDKALHTHFVTTAQTVYRGELVIMTTTLEKLHPKGLSLFLVSLCLDPSFLSA